jgi:hypothetical protein
MTGIARSLVTVLFCVLTVMPAEAQSPRQLVVLADQSGRANTLTGSWYVFIEFPQLHTTAATLSLVQTASAVTGLLAIQDGSSGSVTGVVTGQRLDFSLTSLVPCPGTGTGTMSISSDYRTLSGSLSSSDCNGSTVASLYAANLSAAGANDTSPNVTGSWDVTLHTGTDSVALFTMVQQGAAVTGSAALPRGGAVLQGIVGDLLGTGSEVVQLTAYEISPCPGTFGALLTVSSDGLTANGAWGGADCQGLSSGTVSATRQSLASGP